MGHGSRKERGCGSGSRGSRGGRPRPRATAAGEVWVALALALAPALALGACEETEPPRSPPTSPAQLAAVGSSERSNEVSPSATPWPAEVTGLAATIDEFETTEQCTEELRGRLPPEVTDLVGDLGYDTLLDDACQSVGAVREGSPAACDALSVSAVRRGCRLRLAVFHSRPEACPARTGGTGREANCVAWASRDPELCRAAGPADEAICRAVFAGEQTGCEEVRDDLRSRCRARVGRFGPVVGNDRREVMEEVEVQFRLVVNDASDPDEETAVAVEGDAGARGVVLESAGCGRRLVIGDVGVLAAQVPKASVAVTVPGSALLPGGLPLRLHLRLPPGDAAARLVLAIPQRGVGDSFPSGTGSITVEALGATVGERVVLSVDGELNLPPGRVTVEGRIETFIRDVEPLPAGCEASAPSVD